MEIIYEIYSNIKNEYNYFCESEFEGEEYKNKSKNILIIYFTYDGFKYKSYGMTLDFENNDDDENIKILNNIYKKKNFYAFLNSEKGQKLYNKFDNIFEDNIDFLSKYSKN
jgi:hypothetical protein